MIIGRILFWIDSHMIIEKTRQIFVGKAKNRYFFDLFTILFIPFTKGSVTYATILDDYS